jgi:hypothetical protein
VAVAVAVTSGGAHTTAVLVVVVVADIIMLALTELKIHQIQQT